MAAIVKRGTRSEPKFYVQYLSNRSGLRLGEVCGLRLGDLEFIGEGVIRVAHSYGGPLKEDKRSEGKVKWVPAPIDAGEVLRLHLKRRN